MDGHKPVQKSGKHGKEHRNHGKEDRGANDLNIFDTEKDDSVKTKMKLNKRKMSNKQIQALDLPKLCNINPRSCYNKAEELVTFVKEESLDLIFTSESWERENLPLQELLKLEDHTVISNVNQRVGVGGRPALIVNKKNLMYKISQTHLYKFHGV